MAAEHVEMMGRRMRQRREEKGLSRGQVARAMPGKTSENQIYRWEKGLHRPEDDTLEALATVLEVPSAGWFFAADGAAKATPDLSRRVASELTLGPILAELREVLNGIKTQLDAQTEVLNEIKQQLGKDARTARRIEAATRQADTAVGKLAAHVDAAGRALRSGAPGPLAAETAPRQKRTPRASKRGPA